MSIKLTLYEEPKKNISNLFLMIIMLTENFDFVQLMWRIILCFEIVELCGTEYTKEEKNFIFKRGF